MLNWINGKKKTFQTSTPGGFHCSLALEGDYYVNFGNTLQNCQLSTNITREIKLRTPSAQSYSGNPAHIALGVEYSYVMVGNKGDFCWDLKGHYGNLEKLLKEADYAIKVSISGLTTSGESYDRADLSGLDHYVVTLQRNFLLPALRRRHGAF